MDYIRDHCVVPSEDLKTFSADVIGQEQCAAFAEQWRPVVSAAERAISGLLLFGPSGTGKSTCAQAIASHHNATFYSFGAADLPNGKAGANRVNALFDVALADATPEKPAVIFIDECDTVLSAKATVRAGHFATRFERFMPNLLVIGATNEPQNIAPKILTGRFERKIFVGNPNGDARRQTASAMRSSTTAWCRRSRPQPTASSSKARRTTASRTSWRTLWRRVLVGLRV